MAKKLLPSSSEEEGNGPASSDALRELIADIEAQRGVLGDEAANQMLAMARARVAELEKSRRMRNAPSRQQIQEAQGDEITVKGNVAPGAVVGPGEVHAENLAGKNVVHTDTYVEGGGILIQPTTGWRPPAIDPDDLEANYLYWQFYTASRIPLGQMTPIAPNANGVTPEITLDAIYVDMEAEVAGSVESGRAGARPSTPILRAVIGAPRLVVLGDPGSGKTTLVNFLTLCLAGERLYPGLGFLDRLHVHPTSDHHTPLAWPHGNLLPVRVTLREFAQDLPPRAERGTADMLWGHIQGELAAHGLAKYVPHLERALREGKCLVMLDGLDEVPEKTHRALVRGAVQAFADSYGKCRFIVTCRELSYANAGWKLSDFLSVTLSPLTSTQIEVFIVAWYDALTRLGYITPRQAKSKTLQLQNAAADLVDLAENPMLLTVMAVVHAFHGELPRERARLLEECATLLLWRWQKGKYAESIFETLGAREERLYNGLCEVAYRAHQLQGDGEKGRANIPETEVMGVLKRYMDHSWEKAEIFCKYVEERAGLLVGRGHGKDGERTFAFPHRSFQEFLAGCHLASSPGFERIATELVKEGDRWREALLLAVGHMIFNQRDVNRPLNVIHFLCPDKTPTAEHEWRAVWWAAEMLLLVERKIAEQDELVGRAAVGRVMAQLIDLVQGGQLTPRERAHAADALGRLGDPRPGVLSIEPDLIDIPGGVYKNARLAPFRVGRYPVTNCQFLAFARDDGYGKEEYWTKAGWAWREKAGNTIGGLLNNPTWGAANRPVVGVTWHEAVAYVRWLAKITHRPYRLLTEAEWDRTAAGPDGGRTYPWGSEWADGVANTRETDLGHSTAVGIFPGDKTPEGVYDMGGNVWEWCSSLYREGSQMPGGADDLALSGPRILRGGGFQSAERLSRCANRHWQDPDTRTNMIGFRVALAEMPGALTPTRPGGRLPGRPLKRPR